MSVLEDVNVLLDVVKILDGVMEVLKRVYVLEGLCNDCNVLGMIRCHLIVVQW